MGGFLGKATLSSDTYQIRTAADKSEPDLGDGMGWDGISRGSKNSITVNNVKVTRYNMIW